MTTALTSWSSEILPDIPDAPEPAIINAARDACIRFCEESHLWTYTLDAIDVEEDTQDYTLTIPEALYAELIGVPKDGVYYKADGEDDDQYGQLNCISEELTNKNQSHAWKYESGSPPSDFWVDNVDKQLHLRPIPSDDSTDGLLVTVILKPAIDCTTIPDFLYDDHRKGVGFGALSYLYRMKRMPWYDPDMYLSCEAKFLNACNDAKIKKLTGATNKQLSIDIPFFA